jgi:hypothetical protein
LALVGLAVLNQSAPVRDPNAFRASLKHRHPSSPSLLFHDWLSQDHRITIENPHDYKLSLCQIVMTMSSNRKNCISDAPWVFFTGRKLLCRRIDLII